MTHGGCWRKSGRPSIAAKAETLFAALSGGSVLFEPVLLELQRLSVFGHRADNIVWHPRWDISRDLELDFHVCVDECN